MVQAHIIDAVRTPVGKREGGLAGIHTADLGAHVLKALIERNDFDPGDVEDVVFGCCDNVSSQAGDIARTCWLAAGLPLHVPGVTVDRQCGSSQQAVHFAAKAVMSGTNDLVVAGGVQSMSQIPIGYAMTAAASLGFTDPFSGSKGWVERFGTQEVSQFRGAELIAEKWNISREDMETLALDSHARAIRATEESRFANEIVPIAGVERDEDPQLKRIEIGQPGRQNPRTNRDTPDIRSPSTMEPGSNLLAATPTSGARKRSHEIRNQARLRLAASTRAR